MWEKRSDPITLYLMQKAAKYDKNLVSAVYVFFNNNWRVVQRGKDALSTEFRCSAGQIFAVKMVLNEYMREHSRTQINFVGKDE